MPSGSAVTGSVPASVTDGSTRYVCTGAAVAGNDCAQSGPTNVTLTLTNNATLTWLWRTQRRLSGGSLAGGALTLDGGRNRFADRADAEAQALLEGLTGYYTVALPACGAVSLGAADAAPQGSGYLALTVGARGAVRIAGVLADGTAVSQSSRLILFGGCGPEACVPLFAPLYSRKGWVGGLLWLDPANRTVATDSDLGWLIRWERPGAGPDGFEALLGACGGYYGTVPALAEHYLFGAAAGGVPYHHAGGAAECVAVPEGVAVAVAGGRMAMARATRPLFQDGEYQYGGANATSATLAFSARTGIFRGRFSLYYDYRDPGGRLQHKVVGVRYSGVLVPVRAKGYSNLPAGLGHCLVPDNDPAVKALRLKRSFPVWLDAVP